MALLPGWFSKRSALAMLVCAATSCAAATPKPSQAELHLLIRPETAVVYLDDQFLSGARGLRRQPVIVTPGVHYLTVQAPGYFPHDLRIVAKPGTTRAKIALRPIPP